MDITEQKGSFALLRTATLRNDRFFSIRAISLSLFLYKVNANVDMLCYICIHTVHSCINRLCWRTYNKWEEEWRSAIVNDRLSPYALAQVFFFPAVIIIRVFFLSLPYFSLCLCTNYSELLNIGRVKFTHAWASLLLSFLKLSSRMTAKKRPPSSPGREKTREFFVFFFFLCLFSIFLFSFLCCLYVCVFYYFDDEPLCGMNYAKDMWPFPSHQKRTHRVTVLATNHTKWQHCLLLIVLFSPGNWIEKKNKIHPYGAFDESSWHQRRHNRENRNEYTTSHVTENNEARLFFCIMYQVPGQISWTELRFLDSVETITAAVALLCP